ncbi:uncharacterized protein LOC105701083 isoform X2 [Orussus abietinus]|uniref:uncharacterized protein LOC105701083 isoform X2 n=1 Tax=Orussus abietinus TaxID=222816 RepID=UPI0006262315|nr:uncharacterized protein LOC105701083 isoform X2 [Orussus abietinus]
MWNPKVCVRIVEVLLCLSCVVALRVTDDESWWVIRYNRSRSQEWSILDNVTWGAIGAALATATCAGYFIVTFGLLLAAATGELSGRKTECFFLVLGVILFAIVGGLALSAIDKVPSDLVDNAAVLGALCLVTALVFIGDMLISPPKRKKIHDGTQTSFEKDAEKSSTVMVSLEKEPKNKPANARMSSESGNVNGGFEKLEDRSQDSTGSPRPERISRRISDPEEERNRNFDRVERQLREYTQNSENGRVLRDSQRIREAEEILQRARRSEAGYHLEDIYRRPVDEVDTPPFPSLEKDEVVFPKIVNPGVKIMRVERDDDYRYSDSSQYDNVPTRMRGQSQGILKKRDVSFSVPPPPKGYGDRTKDEIEMLEECFGAIRTTTGTQIGNRDGRTPSTPIDPGYVRHTASNWPQDMKPKTPGSSPDHSRIH